MWRAALFVVVGVTWCVRSLQSFADPEFMDPETASDWFAVLSFSAAWFALALGLPVLARSIDGGRVVRLSALVSGAGAALAGLGNLLEDGLQLELAFWPFIAGAVVTMLGLVAFAVAVAATGRGNRRLLAAIPLATLVGMLLLESGGGVLVLAAWLAAAALAVLDTARTTQRAAPFQG